MREEKQVQKKYCLLVLAFIFMLGTTVASLPPVKAPIEEVRFFVSPTIIPGAPMGALVVVEVWIESPAAWDNTPEGIVGYALSVRGDPRALEPLGVGKIPAQMGFLEDFLKRHGYDPWHETQMLPPLDLDPVTCTILDVSEYIIGTPILGVGAGGGPTPLMRFIFKSRSDVIPSPIDLFGSHVTEINAIYTTADGVDHYVDIMNDGYYLAETPDTMMFDLGGYDPADPLHSDWHELYPTYCDWWTLESWLDNGDGILSASDQIDMDNTDNPGEHLDFHVEWVNPTPVADDGKTDMIVEIKEIVPEFPLGVGLMMALAPAIPIVYLWRRHKKPPSPYFSNSSLGRAQPPGLIEICSKSLNPLLQLH